MAIPPDAANVDEYRCPRIREIVIILIPKSNDLRHSASTISHAYVNVNCFTATLYVTVTGYARCGYNLRDPALESDLANVCGKYR
jgi:hypothetical protein